MGQYTEYLWFYQAIKQPNQHWGPFSLFGKCKHIIKCPQKKCTLMEPKTVNPLDLQRGNFDSLRGWVCFQTHWCWETQQIQNLIGWLWSQICDWLIWGCQDPADPESDWLIVVPALWLADLRVPRIADPKVSCQIAFSRPVLAKLSLWV